MKDKDYKIQVKRIKSLIKKWVKPMGLGWWRIDFIYERQEAGANLSEADYSPKDIGGNWMCAMETRADPYYLTASVTCYLPTIQELDDEDLEEYFLHELMHIFLRPMHHAKTSKEEELVATKLAQAFIWIKK